MMMLIIGGQEAYLSSIAEQIQGDHTIMIAAQSTNKVLLRPEHLQMQPRLVLIDINFLDADVQQTLSQLKSKLVEAECWAFFDSRSDSLKKQLIQMGFHKVVSARDDLNLLIHHQFGTQ